MAGCAVVANKLHHELEPSSTFTGAEERTGIELREQQLTREANDVSHFDRANHGSPGRSS
jgi:hypothetical protein